ncbi:hypothetical protein ACFO1B_51000 [Dactylosporangium siamense]|nr:hypothetical protein [Dactylosporangium siamense]
MGPTLHTSAGRRGPVVPARTRRHYELAVDAPPALRVATAFTELAQAI